MNIEVVDPYWRAPRAAWTARKTWSVLMTLVFICGFFVIPIAPALAGHGDASNPNHLDGGPEFEENPVGVGHTFEVTVTTSGGGTPPAGTKVDFEFYGTNAIDPDAGGDGFTPTGTSSVDASCDTDGSGNCEVILTSTVVGTITAVAWVDDDNNDATADLDFSETQTAQPDDEDDTDVMVKAWRAATASDFILDVEPDGPEQNPVGTSHTWTATVVDASDGTSPVVGANVDWEYVGVNGPGDAGPSFGSPDDTCTTNAAGQCSRTVFGATAGFLTATVWVDIDNNDSTSAEADTGEGLNDDGDNDSTDVVEKQWVPLDASNVVLNVEPESDTNDTGADHTLFATVTSTDDGSPVSATINFEYGGANSGGDGFDPSTPDETCNTGVDGSCSVVLGDSPDSTSAGLTTITAWVAGTTRDAGEGVTETSTPGAAEPDSTDLVQKIWTSPNVLLNVEPETDTNPAGTAHTFTATATDAFGNVPSQTATILFEFVGANDPDDAAAPPADAQCNTNAAGTCTVTMGPGASTSEFGTTTVTAWISGTTVDSGEAPGAAENDDGTDVVLKAWTGQVLDVTPESDHNAAGTDHVMQAFVHNGFGVPISGTIVDFEYYGTNDPDGNDVETSPEDTCTTNSAGTCTVTLGDSDALGFPESTNNLSTTTALAWIDSGNNSAFEGDEGETLTANDLDNTDVVEKGWGLSLFLDQERVANAVGSTWEIEALVCSGASPASQNFDPPDSPGDPLCHKHDEAEAEGGVLVRFEFSGANDPDAGFSPTSPDASCVTKSDPDPSPPPEGHCDVSLTGTVVGTTTVTAWIDSDGTTPTVEADLAEGQDEESQPGNTAEPDITDVALKFWVSPTAQDLILNVEPEVDVNDTGDEHIWTAHVTATVSGFVVDVGGINVDAELTGANDPDDSNTPLTPDLTCTTGEDGTCQLVIPAGTAGDLGTTTVRAWVDTDNNNATNNADITEGRDETVVTGTVAEPDRTDVVEKGWELPPVRDAVLNVEPETETNQVGEDHTWSASVTDGFGNPFSGVEVDVEYVGTNDPDGGDTPATPDDNCTTDASGTCSFTFGDEGGEDPDDAGTLTAIAWIDDNPGAADIERDEAEGREEGSDGGNTAEPDNTDVVEKIWQTGTVTAVERLNLEPETDSNPVDTDHVITATVTDQFGNPVAGRHVDVEYTGANDPDSGNTQASPEDSCVTGVSGTCPITIGDDESTSVAGVTTAIGWIDADNDNSTTEANAEGVAAPENDNDTDVVQKTWTSDGGPPPPTTPTVVDIEPETDVNETGTAHDWSVEVTDDAGTPVPGVVVNAEFGGANDPDAGFSSGSPDDTCTTDSAGTCVITIGPAGTTSLGTTTVTAWISGTAIDTGEGLGPDDNDATDVAEKVWAEQVFELTIPEGATHSGFTTFVLISNPTGTDATDVDVTFLTPSGPISPAGTQNLTVPANSRRTIDVNIACACLADVATRVTSTDIQVHAEAAVHKAGSLAEMIMSGAVSQGQWLMAEGATHSGFTTFITIANPNNTDSTVDVTFFRPGTTTNGPQDLVVPAGSRRTISANTELGTPTDVSTLVEVDSGPPVVAGRSLHKVDDGGDLGIGGSIGSLGPQTAHVVAEGATHSDWHTFVLVFSQGPSVIDISFLTSSGLVSGDQNVAINGRYTIDVNPEVGVADDVATFVTVESGAPVAVEGTIQKDIPDGFVIADSVSANGPGAGDASAPNWLVSEGATHSGFFTFILVSNPNGTAAVVDVDYLTKSSGLVAGPQDVTIPALGRRTFLVNFTVAADDVSTLVTSDSGEVVVEVSIDRISGGFSKGRTLGIEV